MPTSVKIGLVIILIGLLLKACHATVEYIDEGGYNRKALEVMEANELRAQEIMDLTGQLATASAEVAPAPTVTETIEVIKYVEKVINNTVYSCDDLGVEYIRVRNAIRECIFSSNNGGGECIN